MSSCCSTTSACCKASSDAACAACAKELSSVDGATKRATTTLTARPRGRTLLQCANTFTLRVAQIVELVQARAVCSGCFFQALNRQHQVGSSCASETAGSGLNFSLHKGCDHNSHTMPSREQLWQAPPAPSLCRFPLVACDCSVGGAGHWLYRRQARRTRRHTWCLPRRIVAYFRLRAGGPTPQTLCPKRRW